MPRTHLFHSARVQIVAAANRRVHDRARISLHENESAASSARTGKSAGRAERSIRENCMSIACNATRTVIARLNSAALAPACAHRLQAQLSDSEPSHTQR